MSERFSRERMLFDIAQTVSKRSTCNRKHVGAVIAREGRIISIGYAGSPPGMEHCEDVGCLLGPDGGCIRTNHAEANAIAFAAREGISTVGAVLYTTLSPCYSCAKMIIAAGIRDVRYLEQYRDTSGIDLLRRAHVQVSFSSE